MRNPFHRNDPFQRLARRMGRIALGLAGLVLVAQTVLAVHGVVHITRGDDDHCEIAQFAPSLAGCAPATALAPDLPQAVAPEFIPFAPVVRAVLSLRQEPVRGPPVPA